MIENLFDEEQKDGTLAWGAKTYIKRMLGNYQLMFEDLPRKYSSPMESGDSPKLDASKELDIDGIKKYQSMIGALQWCVTLGRFDIAVGVMTMSRFRAAPRKGHIERLGRIYGYLRAYPDGAIRFRTGIPNHEEFVDFPTYDWEYSVYEGISEEIPHDIPEPKGKAVRHTVFVDANLMHCKATGRSATGILHILNQTPVDWYSKRQSTVETATYGSEMVAARVATEQIIDIRNTLREMGIPLDGLTWMFGDNQSVVKSSTIPHSTLKKRHNALSFHRIRAAIAASIMHFCHIKGTDNIADVMTKFLPFVAFWPHIQPILFCMGETVPKSDIE